MKEKKSNIGIEVPLPSKKCNDKHCPFHNAMRIHGRRFTGKVIRNVFHNTTTIEFPRQYYIPKYERYEKKRTRIKLHVPGCMEIEKGDVIRVIETRPISKTKNFVAIEVIKK